MNNIDLKELLPNYKIEPLVADVLKQYEMHPDLVSLPKSITDEITREVYFFGVVLLGEIINGPFYKCPSCKLITKLIDKSNPDTIDEHEYIYGRAMCMRCFYEDDYMSFGEPI